MKRVVPIGALALLAALTVAVAQTATHHGMDVSAGGGSASDKAFEAASDRMMKSMGVKPTGNPDRDFVSMMIPHHQGAIDMARIELQFGKDPMLRKMAEDIVQAQETEIAEMKRWLSNNP
ncbi:MAG: DUF305 domain-containing protein [Microvirga sp.]